MFYDKAKLIENYSYFLLNECKKILINRHKKCLSSICYITLTNNITSVELPGVVSITNITTTTTGITKVCLAIIR